MSDLYRLVYASRNLLPLAETDLAATVAQILATSKANNARVSVTGALMFNAGAFAQVLEGPRHGVEETFERIQRDVRHGDVTVLECGPVPERCFPNWSMAFVGDSPRGRTLWEGLAGQSGFEMSRLDGDAVFRMLHGLVLEEEARDPQPQDEPRLPVALPAIPVAEPEGAGRAASGAEPAAGWATAELARLWPDPSAVAQRSELETLEVSESAGIGLVEDVAVAVLRRALALERQRTSDLRNELDDLRITLLRERARHDAGTRERDLWAERARCLAATLCREAEAVRLDSGADASRQAA